jgi:hypothetical protein
LSLIDILNKKISGIITSKKQYKEFKQNCTANCKINVKKNIILPIISLSPFAIAFLMLILYFGGANKIGKQVNLEVLGVVETKSVNYDKNNKISGYDFIVIDSKNSKEYDIPVTEKIYDLYAKDDKVLIRAKKGFLGIVYDQWFYTQ